ncbi:MAG: hypothetical protein HOO94_06280 [Novosphingobium sp.]|uniref:hypothetical protein n=1 Tax=Novosphingobium sp. TaxID=1874826 RepID=UPI0017B02200|nr:hypothetical protein [Novosphingobium sp.]
MSTTPIQTPSTYVASHAAAYADTDGSAVVVSTSNPLPVSFGQPAATPLAGSASVSGLLGPYVPAPGRAVILSLAGTWTGTVKLVRSTDGGTTRQPLTAGGLVWGQYAANCCEAVWEESDAAATLYLDVTLASGTLAYRLAQ